MTRNLDDEVDFDTPFEVNPDGTLTTRPDLYAPSVYDEKLDSNAWSFWSQGYTGQSGYSGPVMHNSESLGDSRMARDLLAEPGVYVLVPAYWSTDEEDDDQAEGWVVCRLN